MRKTWLVFGTFLGLFILLLKLSEYWFWMRLQAFDYYALAIAVIFMLAGWWLSKKWARNQSQSPDGGKTPGDESISIQSTMDF